MSTDYVIKDWEDDEDDNLCDICGHDISDCDCEVTEHFEQQNDIA